MSSKSKVSYADDIRKIRKLSKEEKKISFRMLWKCFKPASKYFFLDLFLMIIDVICELLVPFISKDLVDAISSLDTILVESERVKVMNNIYLYVGIMAILSVIALGIGIGYMGLATKTSVVFVAKLRSEMFRKIQKFSFKNLDHFEVASLVTRLTIDASNLRMVVLFLGRAGLKSPLLLIASFIFMMILNWFLALIVFCISLIIAVCFGLIIYYATPLFGITQEKLDELNRDVEENCNGIKEIKAFVREEFTSNKFEDINIGYRNLNTKVYSLMNIILPIVVFFSNIAGAIIIYVGGLGMIDYTLIPGMDGPVTNGFISSFSSYSVTMLMAFNFLSLLLIQIIRAVASKRRIDEIFLEKIDIEDGSKDETSLIEDSSFDPTHIENGDIEFIDCGLSYADSASKLAVGPINLKIKSGEIIGIIGGTGSGKSSLISLIPRFYDCTTGQVLVSSHDVKDYSVKSLRDSIGVVSQKSVLFSGTIKENVLWGKKDATDEEVNEALKLAGAYDFVQTFKDKENTIVSQGGKSLSGGQKQRISIARALIKKPKILILDDATSAVDTITESKIRNSFYNELKGTTVLIISQRITSVQEADKILVLDNGNVVGLDTHDNLLKSCHVYQEIYKLQNEGVSN